MRRFRLSGFRVQRSKYRKARRPESRLQSPRSSWPAPTGDFSPFGGPTGGRIRDRLQGAGEQARGAGEHPRGVRDGSSGGPRRGRGGRRPGGEHEFRGASQRDRPEPVQPQGAQELCVLEGLGRASCGECVQLLQTQLLLTRADPACEGRTRSVAEADPGDGRWVNGSRVVLVGVGDLPRQAHAAQVGHHRSRPFHSIPHNAVEFPQFKAFPRNEC